MNLRIARTYLFDPYNMAKLLVALALGYFFLFIIVPTALSILGVSRTIASLDVTPPMRAKIIASLADHISQRYLDADKAARIAADLRQAHAKGEFDDITSPSQLARRLTDFLYVSSNDAHARVDFWPAGVAEFEFNNFWPAPKELPTGIAGLIDSLGRAQAKFGVEDVTQSDQGIAYVKLDGFYGPLASAGRFASVMDEVADSKALIIDLRSNGGGHPETVALLASYFFDKPTHLSDIVARRTGERRRMSTRTDIEGSPYGETRPVYLLTSHQTFSAGEDFAYALQKLNRATVVGEVTRGGAHGTAGARLDPYFIAAIPVTESIHSVTKTNWEGSGIQPDIVAPSRDALTIATNEILKKLGKKS